MNEGTIDYRLHAVPMFDSRVKYPEHKLDGYVPIVAKFVDGKMNSCNVGWAADPAILFETKEAALGAASGMTIPFYDAIDMTKGVILPDGTWTTRRE